MIYDPCTLVGRYIGAILMQDSDNYGPKYLDFFWNAGDNHQFKQHNGSAYVYIDKPVAYDVGMMDSIQRMENVDTGPWEPVSFLHNFYDKWDGVYPNTVWSNWFGVASVKFPVFAEPDKIIIVNGTRLMAIYDYVVQSMLKPIEGVEHIDRIAEAWREDHVEVDGEQLGTWLHKWTTVYRQQAIDAYERGEVKYFFQINRLHWDIFKLNESEIKILDVESAKDRLRNDWGQVKMEEYVSRVREANPNHLLVEQDWYDHLDVIEDYLDMKFNDTQLDQIAKIKTIMDANWKSFSKEYADIIDEFK